MQRKQNLKNLNMSTANTRVILRRNKKILLMKENSPPIDFPLSTAFVTFGCSPSRSLQELLSLTLGVSESLAEFFGE